MKLAKIRSIALGLFLWCLFISDVADAQKIQSKEQDGILSAAIAEPGRISVAWRFLQRKPSPITKIDATVNGRRLKRPEIRIYPEPGKITAVIGLLDLGGTERALQIEKLKIAMQFLALFKQKHHQLGLAIYAQEGQLLAPKNGDLQELARLLLQLKPLDQPSDLTRALLYAHATLHSVPADRRAVYVFSDGHNDGRITTEKIADLYRSTGTAIYLVILPGSRSVDLSKLKKMAVQSGGALFYGDSASGFLDDPFLLIDSGGSATFSLEESVRYFWEGVTRAKIKISLGDVIAIPGGFDLAKAVHSLSGDIPFDPGSGLEGIDSGPDARGIGGFGPTGSGKDKGHTIDGGIADHPVLDTSPEQRTQPQEPGIDAIELDILVDVSEATIAETAQYLLQNHPIVLASASALGILVLLLFIFLFRLMIARVFGYTDKRGAGG